MKTFADFPKFIGQLEKFKEGANGNAKACCPGHNDRHPSLTLKIGDDGRVLVSCKAGCTYQQICDGAGVATTYLMGESTKRGARNPEEYAKPIATYAYSFMDRDGDEHDICQVVELIDEKTGRVFKKIKAHVLDSKGELIWEWGGRFSPVLYRCNEIQLGKIVFLVPTESDANVLIERGYNATTIPGGFRAFTKEYVPLLKELHVCVVSASDLYSGDGDTHPNFDAALAVVKLLFGRVKSVRLCVPSDAPKNYSVGTWMVNLSDNESIQKQRFEELVKSCPALLDAVSIHSLKPQLCQSAKDVAAYVKSTSINMTVELKKKLAEQIKLPSIALDELPELGYDPSQKCFLFPEYGADGVLRGASRRWSNGSKANVLNTKRGLTIPRGFNAKDTGDERPICIVEGASDTLAMTHAGFRCVGRPGNASGGEILVELLKGCPAGTRVVIMGENDARKDENGVEKWPGKEGAEKIWNELTVLSNIKPEIVFPPEGFKDARDFLIARTGTWAERGLAFAQRIGLSSKKDEKPVLAKLDIGEKINELVKQKTGDREFSDVKACMEVYDRLVLKLDEIRPDIPELNSMMIEVCARLVVAVQKKILKLKES